MGGVSSLVGVLGRRRVSAFAGLVALVLLWGSARASAEEVFEAERRLDEARSRADGVTAALDHAAAAYERAAAHHERLRSELDQAQAGVRRAAAGEASAREALRRRVATAYRTPHADLALAGAVLEAPDPGTALHVASLVSRLTVRSAREVAGREQAEHRAMSALRQRRIIAAGAAGAAEAQQQRADELIVALDQAEQAIEQARRDVARAESAARARARAAASRGASSTAAVIVDGKTCPVAGPHGFIDSWGFPRSGGRTHKGVDMFAASGTPLVAVADGTVSRVYTNRLGGLSIDFVDARGDRYYYAHLASARAASGQRVRAGEEIGTVGQSGNARGTPPHLHWQYHPGGGAPVNPYALARALCR
jgi:murein DD-endopeptidase MepM/ murein hydrolase activator NlpD